MRFSDRAGITTPPSQIQVDFISDELRFSLWNLLDESVPHDHWRTILAKLVRDYWRGPVDEVPDSGDKCKQMIRLAIISPKEWYECYNVLEEIIKIERQDPLVVLKGSVFLKASFTDSLNRILARELAGFRFISGLFVPITSDEEVRSVLDALQPSETDEFSEARTHIRDALKKLGEKPTPDYRNSIKESISAVESVCKKITGEKSGGLEKALSKLSAAERVHPRLETAFKALYDYTSSEVHASGVLCFYALRHRED